MRKRKSILFLTPRFFPHRGGVEKHVLKLSLELIRNGFDVSILTEPIDYLNNTNWQDRYIDDKEAEKANWPTKSSKSNTSNNENSNYDYIDNEHHLKYRLFKNIRIYYIPYFNKSRLKKLYIWQWIIKNRKFVQSFDIIHCHDIFIWYFPLRFMYPSKSVYITFHGYEIYPIPLKNIVIRKISEKLASGNICIGDFIRTWYKTHPNIVSYGAVDNRMINLKGSNLTKTKKTIKILFIGRLVKENGVSIYLSALMQLKERKIDFRFEVCGDGYLQKEAQKVGIVHGFVQDATKFIKNADIIFASSYLSILESLAYNKIVISVYDNPLKEDYLKLTPFRNWINIVDSSKALYDLIVDIISNPDYFQNKSEQAEKWLRKQTWKHLAKNYSRLWKI